MLSSSHVDEKDFFLQATLHICSSLDLTTALNRCLDYVKQWVPMDEMMLTWYDLDSHVMHINASTSAPPHRSYPSQISFPRELWADFKTFLQQGEKIFVCNDQDTEPAWMKKSQAIFWPPDISYIRMGLEIEGQIIGAFLGYTRGKNRYTDDHVRLLGLLHEPFAIALSNSIKHQEILRFQEILIEDNKFLKNQLMNLSEQVIIGANAGLFNVMNLVRQVAHLDSPVMLFGETGVGKEVIANAIQQASKRNAGPFIKVNCGAIPETLLDSELFGHEKGAFTGALVRKRGFFERAHKGTIFLDEIGELPPSAQVRLLRVIQDHEIQRVGGVSPVPVDARIICATHRDLKEMVKSGRFREDLWFRLNVFPIDIPPLRNRAEDIPGLVHHFVARKSIKLGILNPPKVEPAAMNKLLSYSWPGNVRELENIVERALIRSQGIDDCQYLNFDHLGLDASDIVCYSDVQTTMGRKLPSLEEANRMHITKALQLTRGRVQGPYGAAELLNIHPSTLRSKMRKLGIPFGRE